MGPDIVTKFKHDGLLVVENILNKLQIQGLSEEIDKIRRLVAKKIQFMPRPLAVYSDIAERHLGRLDYRCGFTADIFAHCGIPIIQLIKTLSPTIDFRHYWGAIPSHSGSGPTDLHRDVYPMLNTSKDYNLDEIDINLPPYYFTVLIPLVKLTQENGPTEFVKGSHNQAVANIQTPEIFAPLLNPGDIVIFDGRTLHRGAANYSKTERVVAYITFVANWYHDQTFVINNYLFPELA